MKNAVLFSLFTLSLLLLITSCSQQPAPAADSKITKLAQKDTITPNQYREWKDRWERKGAAYTNNKLTKYFTMPLIDLTEFMSNGNHVAARYVLGLDSTQTTASNIIYTPHLMLVGVDNTGTSMVPPYAAGNVYDVTRPCPDACGINSIN